jgi:hypothetical protein
MIGALLEFLLALGEVVFSWRVYLCVIIGAVFFGAILLFVPEFPLRMVSAIGGTTLIVIVGIVWSGALPDSFMLSGYCSDVFYSTHHWSNRGSLG